METIYLWITLLVSCPCLTSALYPILNPDNSTNMDSLVEHVKALEQLVTGLTGSELPSIKNELTALKVESQKDRAELTTVKAELAALKVQSVQNNTELTTLKSEMATLKIQSRTEIDSLKAALSKPAQDQVNRTEIDAINAELTILRAESVQDYAALSNAVAGAKAEMMAVKAELRMGEGDIQHIEDRLKNLTNEAEITDLKHELESLKSGHGSRYQVNLTIIDVISHDVKSNTRDIEALMQSVNKIETDNKETEKQLQAFVSQWNQSKLDLDTELTLLKNELSTTENASTSARGHLESSIQSMEGRLNNTEGELAQLKSLSLTSAGVSTQAMTNITAQMNTNSHELGDLKSTLSAALAKQNGTTAELEKASKLAEQSLKRLDKVEAEISACTNSSLHELLTVKSEMSSSVNRLESKLNHTQEEVVDNKQSAAACVHLVNVVADRSRNHTEQEIAKMKGDIDHTVSDMNSTIMKERDFYVHYLQNKFQVAIGIVNSNISELKNATSDDINKLQQTINHLQTNLRLKESRISDLEKETSTNINTINTLNNEIHDLTQRIKGNDVGFRATSHSQHGFGFYYTDYNHGGGFKDGKFVAPVSGAYMFLLEATTYRAELVSVKLYQGDSHNSVHPNSVEGYDHNYNYHWSTLLYLNAGENVHMSTMLLSHDSHVHGHIVNAVFAGALITPA